MASQAATAPQVLVVDDEPDLRTLYELTLVREGYDVECAGSVEEAWSMLSARGPDGYQLVITDMRLPDGNGLDLLRRMDDAGRRVKGIVITAYGSAENAVEALKAGAYDYLTKPVDLRQFRAAVASALGRPAGAGTQVPRERRAEPRVAEPMAAPAGRSLQRMAGSSEAMNQVRLMVEKVARSMAPVLVQGESGTGKELVARAIHDVSPRRARPFVAVNCGAIPEALLESEFFGVRKGAFTGAHEDRDGFFQAAQGGTLFLDEIGDLPLLMQTKLLRVIQERVVRQVGGVTELPVDVRLVSATHKDLGSEVQAGRFRQDLYYRLNVIRINVRRCASAPATWPRSATSCWSASRETPVCRPGRCWAREHWSTCGATPFRAMCASSKTCCTAPWRCPAGRPSNAPISNCPRPCSTAPRPAMPTLHHPPVRPPTHLQPRRCPRTWRHSWTVWSATSSSARWTASATTAPLPGPAWA